MRSLLRTVLVVVILAVVAGGCSGDDGETTTTTALDPVTTLEGAAASETTAGGAGATTSTAPDENGASTTTSTEAIGPPAYEIALRTDGEDGDTVVVVLDPTSYTSLSDIDLQSVIRDVYDRFPPIVTAHVVDTDDVVDLVVAERALTDDELRLLDEHYFARLEEGIRIVFLGKFDEYDIAILGS